MCYRAAELFTSHFPNLSTNFSNYISVSIMHIIKPPIPYNFITLFNILIMLPDVCLGMHFIVTDLSFLADVIMNAFLMTNITYAVSVTNLCDF